MKTIKINKKNLMININTKNILYNLLKKLKTNYKTK